MTRKERQVILDHMTTDAYWLEVFEAEGSRKDFVRHVTNLLRLEHLADALGIEYTYEIATRTDPLYGRIEYREYKEV